MADLNTLVRNLRADGTYQLIMRNPQAQFGRQSRRYIGAELLPEREVALNLFREMAIRYRTIIANAGTRYGPAQKKKGQLVGDFLVELAHSDIAREMDARDYDILIDLLASNQDMEGVTVIVNFVDELINRALIEWNELARWQAMISAAVSLVGDNGYSETVTYSNPAGHRVNAGGTWSSDAYDLWDDILVGADLLASKGYRVARIVTSRPVLSIMSGNDKVKTRTGVATISPTGQITATAGRATQDAINAALGRDDLPPIETYDLQYRTQTGSGYFLARNVLAMFGATDESTTVDRGDLERIFENVLGYLAVGRAAGQSRPGRATHVQPYYNKPPRVEAEGWQTSLPVIMDPEAIYVIGSIA